jgi:hypothetical protein
MVHDQVEKRDPVPMEQEGTEDRDIEKALLVPGKFSFVAK